MSGTHRAPRGSHRATSPPRRHRVLVIAGAAAVVVTGGGWVAVDLAIHAPATAPRAGAPRPPLDRSSIVLPASAGPRAAEVAVRPRSGRVTPDDPVQSDTVRPPRKERLPESGSGEFAVASGESPTAGTGVLVTYTVEVEREVPVGRNSAAGVVDRVLADPRGWTASGAHALARTNSSGDLRVLLATPETTDRLCAPLDTAGRYSCRNGELVVLNAWRWLNGASAYGDNIRDYRRYLVNHEVGHALGNGHVGCPGPGELAPVMMQQTKGTDACVASPWPVT
jgi:hypothetical protein